LKYVVPADSAIYQFQFSGFNTSAPDSIRYYTGLCSSLIKIKGLKRTTTEGLGQSFNFVFQNSGVAPVTIFIQVYTSSAKTGTLNVQSKDVPEMGPCELIQNGNLNDLQASQPYDPWILWPFTPDPMFTAPNNTNPTAQNGDPGYVGMILGLRGGPVPDPRVREAMYQPLSNSGILNTGDIVYGEFWVAAKNHPDSPFPTMVRNSHDCIDMVFEQGPSQSFPQFDLQNKLLPNQVPTAHRRISSIQNGVATIQPMSSTWQKVAGITSIDKNGVDHVIITNFRSDNFTNPRYVNPPPISGLREYSYAIVDDVYITSLPDAGPDASISCGEEIQLGHNSCPNLKYPYTVQWTPAAGLSDPNIPNPVASPSVTTTYTLTGTYNGYTYQDQVTVTVNEITMVVKNCGGQIMVLFNNLGNINQVTPVSESGLWYGSVNPSGPNEIVFDGVQITNYQGYGLITVNIEFLSTQGVVTTCKANITVVECCQEWTPDRYLVGGTISDAFGPSSNGVANEKIQIFGQVVVDVDFTFQANDIFLAPDASLVLNEGIQLTMLENSMEPLCDYRWDRVHAPYQSNGVTFQDNVVRGGLRALHIENDAQLLMHGNQMNSNRISLLVENCNQNSDPDLSVIQVYSNIFQEIYTLANDIPQHPSSPIDIFNNYVVGGCQGTSPYWNTGVMVLNSENIQIGDPNQNANEFVSLPQLMYRREGIRVRNSKAWIRNNEFSEDNFSICGFDNSALRVGGGASDANLFSVLPSQSTLMVKNSGIEASRNNFYTSNAFILDPVHIGFGGSLGAHFNSNILDNSVVGISCNATSTSYVRVADNAFNNSLLSCDNVDLNANGKLIVTGNTFTRTNGAGLGKMHIRYCNGAEINLNVITSNVTGAIRPAWGMLSEVVTNANFCSNTFSAPANSRGFERALVVTGDQTGTQYSSNVFNHDHNYGLFWDNPSNLSNQGSTSQGANNDWGSFSGANRWGESCNNCSGAPYFYSTAFGSNAFNPNFPSTLFSLDPSGGQGSCTPIVIRGESLDLRNNDLIAYPNPVNDVIFFNGPTLSEIRIYNMMGQICGQAQGPVTNFPFSGFETGLYVIEYADENGKKGFIKVLKE
jgi:hypothetical protein